MQLRFKNISKSGGKSNTKQVENIYIEGNVQVVFDTKNKRSSSNYLHADYCHCDIKNVRLYQHKIILA